MSGGAGATVTVGGQFCSGIAVARDDLSLIHTKPAPSSTGPISVIVMDSSGTSTGTPSISSVRGPGTVFPSFRSLLALSASGLDKLLIATLGMPSLTTPHSAVTGLDHRGYAPLL